MMMKAVWKKEQGFTLIELLIVVAIIGILAGIAVPRLSSSTQKAKEAACDANIDAMESAAEMYNFEEGRYPTFAELIGSVYLTETPQCPFDDAKNDSDDYTIDSTNGAVSCALENADGTHGS